MLLAYFVSCAIYSWFVLDDSQCVEGRGSRRVSVLLLTLYFCSVGGKLLCFYPLLWFGTGVHRLLFCPQSFSCSASLPAQVWQPALLFSPLPVLSLWPLLVSKSDSLILNTLMVTGTLVQTHYKGPQSWACYHTSPEEFPCYSTLCLALFSVLQTSSKTPIHLQKMTCKEDDCCFICLLGWPTHPPQLSCFYPPWYKSK